MSEKHSRLAHSQINSNISRTKYNLAKTNFTRPITSIGAKNWLVGTNIQFLLFFLCSKQQFRTKSKMTSQRMGWFTAPFL